MCAGEPPPLPPQLGAALRTPLPPPNPSEPEAQGGEVLLLLTEADPGVMFHKPYSRRDLEELPRCRDPAAGCPATGAVVGETAPGPPQPRPLHDIHKHKALESVFSVKTGTRSELASGSAGWRTQDLLLSVQSGASVVGGSRVTTLLVGEAGVKHVRGMASCHQLRQTNKY